ncbi:MAG: hypothetical protein H7318_14635 [Oligoflexus sp.]|nr:hypothetical protein [Oligoflexus sp.]
MQMIRRKIILLAALSSPVQAADMLALRQAEKVSMTLTGRPLPSAMRKDYLAGKIPIAEIANALSQDPQFIEYFAQYWARTMGFLTPFQAYSLDVPGKGNIGGMSLAPEPTRFDPKYPERYNATEMAKVAAGMKTVRRISVKLCDNAPMVVIGPRGEDKAMVTAAANTSIGPGGQPILAGSAPYWKDILPLYIQADLACDDPTLKTVTPWWDPDTEVNSRYVKGTPYTIPPLVLERCGARLELCNSSGAGSNDVFMDHVNTDMMMEPAYLIAHTVAEDRPYSEIINGTDTIMTGTYASFMAKTGLSFWANFPGGAFDDVSTHPIFVTPNAADRKHYRIKRNANHAGILTTPAYQLLTNGRRAKANRAYETFLCKKFSVPDGAQPDPNDANPDLTKRAYCTYCHKSLEPMAAFFNRWPTTGVRNYFYETDIKLNDTGRFMGQEGKGANVFGKILAENESFGDCAVKRAFEFVNGRPMSILDRDNKLPAYVNQFKGSSMNLRQVIRSMVLAPEFLNPKGD